MSKALLVAVILSASNPAPSTVLEMVTLEPAQCKAAMHQVVRTYNLQNQIYSSGPEYVKARFQRGTANAGDVLKVTCKSIEPK